MFSDTAVLFCNFIIEHFCILVSSQMFYWRTEAMIIHYRKEWLFWCYTPYRQGSTGALHRKKILSVSCKDFLKDAFVALLQSWARSAMRCWEHQIKKSADQPRHERGHNSMQCSEEYPTQEYTGSVCSAVFKPDTAHTLLLQMQHLMRT